MTCQDSFHEVAFNISFWTRNISSARILFWRGVVSSKNLKRTFLSSKLLPDGFYKTLFYGDMVNNSICLCVEFHGLQLSSFWSVESQRNRRSGHITASLATFFPLNNLEIFFILIYLIISFLALGFWETH